MTIFKLRTANNGYIFQLTEFGEDYVAATLKDVAAIAGEYDADNSTVHYRHESGNQMPEIIHLARQRKKIEAIKLMRSQYTHTLGLREAKDLVEALMDAYVPF